MAERHFTFADIQKFFIERTASFKSICELESIQFLPELSPPAWLVHYKATYHKGECNEWTNYDSMLVIEKQDNKGQPWLNGPMSEELPRGCATPAEEDAEIKRRFDEWWKAWEAEQQATKERTTPEGSTIIEKPDGSAYLRSGDVTFEV